MKKLDNSTFGSERVRESPVSNKYHWYSYIFAIIIFALAYWGITTNSDWTAYETWYSGGGTGVDKAFAYLSLWFNNHGLSYRMLYRFHIILMAVLNILLFRKLRVNPVLFVIVMLLFNYVALGNQIRYYVGFPLALLSVSCFLEKRYAISVLLGILGYFFHSSLLLLFACFFCYYVILRKLKKFWFAIAIVVSNFVLFYLIHNYLSSEHYETYLFGDRVSSILGGIYNLFPSFVYLFFTHKIDRIIKEDYPEYATTSEYKFLYGCIMMGMVLLVCSLQTQIISHRLMGVSLLPIWLAYFVKSYNINDHRISRLVSFCLFVVFAFYILHNFGGLPGSKENIYHIREMLNSYSLH